MQDTVEITLPVSGKKVVIRNYTTRADDKNAEAIMSQGVNAEQTADGSQNIKFPVANVMAADTSYVYRLVTSIDGNTTALDNELDGLHSKDFGVIKTAVDAVVNENSPKAKEASEASKIGTTAK